MPGASSPWLLAAGSAGRALTGQRGASEVGNANAAGAPPTNNNTADLMCICSDACQTQVRLAPQCTVLCAAAAGQRQWWAVPWCAALRCLVIRTRPFCEPGGSPIPPTESPPTSPYASPPTPPPPPSPDAPQRRSSQQPGLRAEGTPGWPTSLLSCLRSLSPSPPSRLRSCRSSRTVSEHETAPYYT